MILRKNIFNLSVRHLDQILNNLGIQKHIYDLKSA
jgi:hypothetical protein